MGNSSTQREAKDATLGRVSFLDGQGELPLLEISTRWSTAEIYLHGAHVTRFTKKDEAPLLFMSQCSRFEPGQPIRGGIPIIFPWFGQREGMGAHGFARLKPWELKEFAPAPDGSVSVRLRLPDCPEASTFTPFTADYIVTVNEALTLQLVVTNRSEDQDLSFENCLHTYFETGDIEGVSISGLKGVDYLDKVAGFARKTETDDAIRIASEVDRIYMDTNASVEIQDAYQDRRIQVEKSGSNSTIVWNPWTAKAQQMPDFGNEEFERMVCVESGNVGPNALKLKPGESSTLRVTLRSEKL